MRSPSKKWNRKLGKYLAASRKNTPFSQRQVAQHFGFTSAQFISNIERGLCAVPLSLLAELVNLYGLNPNHVAEMILTVEKERLERDFFKHIKKRKF